jgi:N-acetylneuraminic acid mutarotase
VVFGGYYDNLRNCRFYNDTYLFNLETEQWEEMVWKSNGLVECPSVRSACQLAVCGKNNTIVLYGGFSKEKLKKEREKAFVHSDMFVLHNEGWNFTAFSFPIIFII